MRFRRHRATSRRSLGLMSVMGEMFPGPKVLDEAGEAGDGERWRLGPIDLENGVVEVHRADAEAAAQDGAQPPG